MRGKRHSFPVVIVGGAAPLLQPLFCEFGLQGWMPVEAPIANAHGAGMAEISHLVEVVTSLKEREKVLEELKEQARAKAAMKGADPKKVRIAAIFDLALCLYFRSLG